MYDKITTLKLIDNTDVFPNIKDENIPDTIMRIADLSKYLNQLKSININGDIDSTTMASDIATFKNVHVDGNLFVNGIDNIVDKNGNKIIKIINTGTFDPTSDNPASQKSIADRTIDLSRIVDSKGHQRFIERNLILQNSYDNVDIKYDKWSLSGTHLMFVIFGTYTGSPVGLNFIVTLPSWIYPKIYRDNHYYAIKTTIPFRTGAVTGSTEFEATATLETSDTNGFIRIYDLHETSNTLWFRLQYDLLIDTD